MSKLEEAADNYSIQADEPEVMKNAFITGALWLLGEAKKKEYVVKSIDTDGMPCEIDELTRISYLEELCE